MEYYSVTKTQFFGLSLCFFKLEEPEPHPNKSILLMQRNKQRHFEMNIHSSFRKDMRMEFASTCLTRLRENNSL